MVKGYRDLDVWRRALDLSLAIYRVSAEFPPHEQFGLRSQLRRAGVSVASNIAEGNSRASTKEYVHAISISRGSLAELDTQLEIAVRLQYIPASSARPLQCECDELGRMLRALQAALLKTRSPPKTRERAPSP